jgi:hypothetical protein
MFTNKPQQPIIFRDEKFSIHFGRIEEFSMGGAYACAIYFVELDEDILMLHNMCADRPLFSYDYKKMYFTVWYSNEHVRLQHKIARFDMTTKKVSLYEKTFRIANIKELHNGVICFEDEQGKEVMFDPETESIFNENFKVNLF